MGCHYDGFLEVMDLGGESEWKEDNGDMIWGNNMGLYRERSLNLSLGE